MIRFGRDLYEEQYVISSLSYRPMFKEKSLKFKMLIFQKSEKVTL